MRREQNRSRGVIYYYWELHAPGGGNFKHRQKKWVLLKITGCFYRKFVFYAYYCLKSDAYYDYLEMRRNKMKLFDCYLVETNNRVVLEIYKLEKHCLVKLFFVQFWKSLNLFVLEYKEI